MSSISLTPRDLDVQISELDQALAHHVAQETCRIVDAKRRRNALMPIAQLPAEIVRNIFLLAAKAPHVSLDGHRSFSTYTTAKLTLCHVDYTWRMIALSFPQLWTDIAVQGNTTSRMISFMLKNASPLPISLTYQHIGRRGSSMNLTVMPRAFKTLKAIISDTSNRLKRITFSHLSHSLLASLLEKLPSQSGLLVAVDIEVYRTAVDDRFNMAPMRQLNMLEMGAPNLREIRMKNTILSWDSGLLIQSHRLTSLELTTPPTLTLKQVRAVLGGSASTFERLSLDLPRLVDINGAWNRQPHGTRLGLPQLKTLKLSGSIEAILPLLASISVPPLIRETAILGFTQPAGVVGRKPMDALYAYGNSIRSNLSRDGEGNGLDLVIEPIELTVKVEHPLVDPDYNHLGFVMVYGVEGKYTNPVPIHTPLPSNPLPVEALDERTFHLSSAVYTRTAACDDDPSLWFPLQHFIPSTSEYRAFGWSLDRLETFTATVSTLPLAWWEMLSALPSLSRITFQAFRWETTLLPLLVKTDGPIPFPGLRELQVRGAFWNSARDVKAALATRLSRVYSKESIGGAFAGDGVLDKLLFTECFCDLKTIEDSYPDLLERNVARDVGWEMMKRRHAGPIQVDLTYDSDGVDN